MAIRIVGIGPDGEEKIIKATANGELMVSTYLAKGAGQLLVLTSAPVTLTKTSDEGPKLLTTNAADITGMSDPFLCLDISSSVAGSTAVFTATIHRVPDGENIYAPNTPTAGKSLMSVAMTGRNGLAKVCDEIGPGPPVLIYIAATGLTTAEVITVAAGAQIAATNPEGPL
jgi:hypothetical protein